MGENTTSSDKNHDMYKPRNFEEVYRDKATYKAFFKQQQKIARGDRERALDDNIADVAAADFAYLVKY
ncbi:hypothetical protein ANCCAN_04841 [Ancylostoma caninum]|uniref:Uncharacterized protein n=1 Tax=Ancylostoma caninum TaxID=29170 RepID=A0A368GXL8_ANCCA|nr:hypothetical protein ANCCAN_04841 [Ancylostoma caninum]